MEPRVISGLRGILDVLGRRWTWLEEGGGGGEDLKRRTNILINDHLLDSMSELPPKRPPDLLLSSQLHCGGG